MGFGKKKFFIKFGPLPQQPARKKIVDIFFLQHETFSFLMMYRYCFYQKNPANSRLPYTITKLWLREALWYIFIIGKFKVLNRIPTKHESHQGGLVFKRSEYIFPKIKLEKKVLYFSMHVLLTFVVAFHWLGFFLMKKLMSASVSVKETSPVSVPNPFCVKKFN